MVLKKRRLTHKKKYAVVRTDEFGDKSTSRRRFETKLEAKQYISAQKKQWAKSKGSFGKYDKYKIVLNK